MNDHHRLVDRAPDPPCRDSPRPTAPPSTCFWNAAIAALRSGARRRSGIRRRRTCRCRCGSCATRSGRRVFALIGHAGLGQEALGDIAGSVNRTVLADGIELERAFLRIRDDRDRRRRLRLRTAPDWHSGSSAEQREVSQQREQAAGQDDGLSADLVRQPAEQHEDTAWPMHQRDRRSVCWWSRRSTFSIRSRKNNA